MSIFYLSEGSIEKAETTLLRLLALQPISVHGFHRLLDLYIHQGTTLKFCNCYERYKEIAEQELGEKPEKYYKDLYEKYT